MSERRAKNVRTAVTTGAFSGTVSTLLFQPLDLLKTRIQISKQSRSENLYKVFKNVIKSEKFTGLWTGTVPSLYRTVPGIGIYYGCLHVMDGMLRDNPGHFQRFATGATARCFAVFCLMPVSVIKIRFESGKFNYKTVPGAFHNIWINEGFKGLYKGLPTTIMRDAPYSGAYLMCYGEIKQLVKQGLGKDDLGTIWISICALSSGIFASFLTHPPDVVKTCIQASTEQVRSVTVAKTIYQENGFRGFFKGFVPRTLRRTLISAMTWTVYEKVMTFVGIQ